MPVRLFPILIVLLAAFCLFAPPTVSAAPEVAGLVVTPSLIDDEMDKQNRVGPEYKIRIENRTGNKASIYPLVYDLSKDGMIIKYSDPSELSSETSLTKWIEITHRALIELEPGSSTEEILKINPAPEAKEGLYHAIIVMAQGGNQTVAAEAADKLNQAKIIINFTVKEHVVERLEIAEFKTKPSIQTKSPLSFSLKLKNIGNKMTEAKGEIVVFNKGGKEMAFVNLAPSSLAPSETKTFPLGTGLKALPGRYKAQLTVEYGGGNKNLQDVIYFVYLPKKILLAFGLLILIGAICLTIWINNKKKGRLKKPPEIKEIKNNYVINLKK